MDTDQRIKDMEREYLDFLDDEVKITYYRLRILSNCTLDIFRKIKGYIPIW